MTRSKKFNTRLLDSMVASEESIKNACGKLVKWDGRNGYQAYNYILRCSMRIKVLESIAYSDTDLRGLSKAEKEFIRENDYKSYIDVKDVMGKTNRYYIFIAKNSATGKNQVYGQSKKQLIDANGSYFPIAKGSFNYDMWLTLNTNDSRPFDKFHYERRFCRSLCPIAIMQ